MIAAFMKGTVLGMSLVMPLGPQNAFILRTGAFESKWHRILAIVAMAALCDALLVLGAVHGSGWIEHVSFFKTTLLFIGIVFLLCFGYKLWKAPIKEMESESLSLNLFKQLAFCATISIFNPHAIIDTFVVIGAVATEYSELEKHWFGWGCIFMDCLWFVFLASVGFFVKKMKQSQMLLKILNRLSAAIMFYVAIDLFVYYLNN